MLLGPLTTTWTPPPACTTYASDINPAFTNIFVQYRTCTAGTPMDAAVPCWPSATTTPPAGQKINGFGYYSPGLYCPQGYTSACTQAFLPNGAPSPMTSGVSFSFQFPPAPGETAIGCCPNGMACVTDYYHFQTCSTDVFNLQTTVTAGTCDSNTETNFAGVEVVTVRTAQFFAGLIQLNHRASDLGGVVTTTAAATTTTPAPTASQTASMTTIATSTSTPSSTPSDNSSTSKIGIGVGIGVGAALLIAIGAFALWFFMNRRRKMQNQEIRRGLHPGVALDNNQMQWAGNR